MKLSKLLLGINAEYDKDKNIKAIARDSRDVETGSLFFAIAGTQSDGHDYAEKAIENGAAAIVVERDLGLQDQIIVENSKKAYGIVCGNFYENPTKKLKLIGITGTNGKTTTAYITKGILEAAGKKTGLIGTIENLIGSVSIQARHTTPDPLQLHRLFTRMVTAGCEYVVMEVSSHALDQERLAGCHFAAAGFSNLTQDHLDYHGTMENYFNAKKKLFDISDTAVVNIDDQHGRTLVEEITNETITYSCKDQSAEFFATGMIFSPKGSGFNIEYKGKKYQANFVQPGEYSVSNALMALGLAVSVGISPQKAVSGLANTGNIPGRFELISNHHRFTVIRDFAHSADGLEKLLSTVKAFVKGRVIIVFGCAGERDRSKRARMAEVVSEYADLSVMTADNPRSEPVGQILNDALPGFKTGSSYKIFTNRLEAISWTMGIADEGDYIILAGKGHEDYQVLDYGTVNFNEKEIVLSLLEREDEA